MSTFPEETPSFNLWYEPWITLEDAQGRQQRLGIEQTLLQAHQYTTITELSPLVVVGIRRLLTAILQAIFNPQRVDDLRTLLAQAAFPPERIQAFGQRYATRFDLFSPEAPFLQSADLPLQPSKGDKSKAKTVAYLAPELPAGSEVVHFRHGGDDAWVFCPVCAAGCLSALPAFTTVGGRGLKSSINGVPPIYVLPEGHNLFESLAYSLVLPGYQPSARSRTQDLVWWERDPIIHPGQEVTEVGYLHSLTFPARRVRLHPERLDAPCSRCGAHSLWGVRTMVFEMGECRPPNAPPWFDPFVAYGPPNERKGDSPPQPIQLKPHHALWREYVSLFLEHAQDETQKSRRPAVLDQIAELIESLDEDAGSLYSFRCVGLRTEQAKVFEWVEAGFEVPPALLRDQQGGYLLREAIEFAEQCASIIRSEFKKHFIKTQKRKGDASLCTYMEERFWTALAAPFRELVFQVSTPDQAQRLDARKGWMERCLREARDIFRDSAQHIGDDAAALRRCIEAENVVSRRLKKLRNEVCAR
ncbi:MAG: type I-E CRISPR-associated protein Cse1/CasA [Anaerolineae bacterium]